MDALRREVVGAWDEARRMVWRCRRRRHTYKATLAERVARLAWAGGNGCPRCSLYGEECVAAWLRDAGEAYEREVLFPEWDATAWRYDFVLRARRVVIEVDGDQHFERVNRRWTPPAAQQARDRAKTARALVRGYHVVRVRQRDVVRRAGAREDLLGVVRALEAGAPASCYVVAEDVGAYGWLTGSSS